MYGQHQVCILLLCVELIIDRRLNFLCAFRLRGQWPKRRWQRIENSSSDSELIFVFELGPELWPLELVSVHGYAQLVTPTETATATATAKCVAMSFN